LAKMSKEDREEFIREKSHVFRDRIESYRASRGWTKTYMAEELGMSAQAYANFINEYNTKNSAPPLHMLCKARELTGLSIDYLLGYPPTTTDDKLTSFIQEQEALLSSDVDPNTKEQFMKAMRKMMQSIFPDEYPNNTSDENH